MRIAPLLSLVALLAWTPLTSAAQGLVTRTSAHPVAVTLDRLEGILEEKGLTIFARIDHAAGAAGVDRDLRPTQVLIFGNPNVGTLLMQSAQSVAVDLPMKAVAWEDDSGTVHLGYNDPGYLVARHGILDRDAVVAKIRGLLEAVTARAAR